MSGAPVALGNAAVLVPRVTLRFTAVHAALLRRVRLGVLRRWFGAPLLVLETTGHRSGERRAATLAYLPDGDDLIVVPANAGAHRTPASGGASQRSRRSTTTSAAPPAASPS